MRPGDRIPETSTSEAERERLATRAMVLTFAAALAALVALLSVAALLYGEPAGPLGVVAALPIVVALALLAAATVARGRLRRAGRALA